MTSWNETRAEQLRGGWGWADVSKWEMSISEKVIVARDEEGAVIRKKKETKGKVVADEWEDWAWVHIVSAVIVRCGGVAGGELIFTMWLGSQSQMNFANEDGSEAIDYNLAGVHQRSTGEYTMVGMPSG